MMAWYMDEEIDWYEEEELEAVDDMEDPGDICHEMCCDEDYRQCLDKYPQDYCEQVHCDIVCLEECEEGEVA